MKTVTKIDRITDTATKKKLRVAAYCRVSTDTDAQLESLETQKSHYENYIRSRDDCEFAGLYYDEAVIIGLKPPSINGRRFSPIFYLPGISRNNTRICHF
jgi:hypothetical protein